MFRKDSKKSDIKKQRRLHHWKIRLTFFGILITILAMSITIYLKKDQIVRKYNDSTQAIVNWTAAAGLVVDEIFIYGRHHTTQKEILQAVGVKAGDPMLNFDISYAQKALEKLGWIQQVSIQRRWPNTLYIHLTERSPMALWQHNKKVRVVDQSGKVLSGISVEKHSNLPVIVGMNSPQKLPKLLEILSTVPGLFERVTSATWVGNRRWNLSLDKNLTLLLPEQDAEDALKRFQKYEKHHKISVNAFHKIDLRLKNRLIID